MSGRPSKARCTPSQASQAYLEAAREAWDELNAWYKAHPTATFDEIEQVIGEQGRGLLGEAIELLLRQGDLGATPDAPRCDGCGRVMVFKGYPEKTVHGLKVDSEIPRAYYVCPVCEAGIFPPRPTSPTAAR
jgi:hypothetical protein